MSRVRTRLEQYKTEIENKSQYKHGRVILEQRLFPD